MNILYIRTSTKDNQEPKNQLKSCINMVGKQDYRLYEEQQSAWKKKQRPIFSKIIDLIKKGKVDNIYVRDLDRLYRNRKALVSFFKLCKIYKTKIHSARQDWLENIHNIEPPFNDIMFTFLINVLGWIAEDECNKKSERIKDAIRKTKTKTVSYKGNKWGRKEIPPQKKSFIKKYKKMNPEITIRTLAKKFNLSKSTISRILSQNHC